MNVSTLPTPRYTVELLVVGKKHEYRVRYERGPEDVLEPVLPGVTGVLSIINKPALINWSRRIAIEHIERGLLESATKTGRISIAPKKLAALLEVAYKNPDKLKDDAANLGTQIHAYIDTIVRGEQPRAIPDEILTPVAAFSDWFAKSGLEFISGDTKVASLEHGYGGSLDAIGRRGDALVLIDWKSAKSIHAEFALQIAAYVRAFEEMYGLAIDEAICVRFRKDGVRGAAFQVQRVRDIEHSFQAFLAAKALKERMALEHFVE